MARAAHIQASFAAGELSPLMAGRVGTQEYEQGLDTCLGYIPLAQGGITAAPGTKHVASVKNSANSTHVVRFEFSTEQAYMIEFGDLYCRFYKDRARIEEPAGTPVEVVTPYTAAQVAELQFTQSADVLYIAHPSHKQRKLTRTSHTAWTLSEMEFRDGPYLPINSTLDTITPAAKYYGEVANPKNFTLNGIADSGVMLCAVGVADGTDAYIVTSSDRGISWAEQSLPSDSIDPNVALHAVVWVGQAGIGFVAVGAATGTGAATWTSDYSGQIWTFRTNPKNFALNGIAFGGGFLAAVGDADGTDAYIVTSNDFGVTWTERGNPSNINLNAIVAADGCFIAVGDSPGVVPYIVVCGDGFNIAAGGATATVTVPKALALNAIAWNGAFATAVGAIDGATDTYILTNGSTAPTRDIWTERVNPKNFALNAILWASNKWIAAGGADGTDADFLGSDDAITWTEKTNAKNFGINGAAWTGRAAILVGAADGTDAYVLNGSVKDMVASRPLFALTDVGRFVRVRHTVSTTDTWGYARITEYLSAQKIRATVLSDFSAATASTFWRLGVWSDTTGYPRSVAFYEDRLFFAGATNYPQRIDGSNSGDYENFAPTATDGTVAASNAIDVTLGSREINTVYWLADDEKALVAGTPGGPWLIRPSANGEALAPTNVAAKRLKSYGSSPTQAVHMGDSVAYVQRDTRKLRSINYSNASIDGFSTPDLTLASEHITRGGVSRMAVQLSPQPILWAVRADGVLLGMTFAPAGADGSVAVGWARHIRGGSFGAGNAVVESVAVIPSPDGLLEDLWMVVKRTIDGATLRTIEYMGKIFDEGDDIEDAFFVDCGLTYDGVATTTVPAAHLEGQTVHLLVDGAAHAPKVVTAGVVTLDRSATKVQYGLPFTARFRTLRIDLGAQNGTSQGKVQRIHQVALRVHSTAAMVAGPTFDLMDEVLFRTSEDPTDAPIPPQSADKIVDWDGDYSTDARICGARDKPMPQTLLAILPQLATEDRG